MQKDINDAADTTGILTLGREYTGAGSAPSVSITRSLILDLNGWPINDITLHIGNSAAPPAVTIRDSNGSGNGNGKVNCNLAVLNAIRIDNGSLTVESGTMSGDRDNGNGIILNGGSVTIQGGTITGHTGINYLGGSLTFDCAVGKTAAIAGSGIPGGNSLSLANNNLKSVTVAGDTQVKIKDVVVTDAADLSRDVADDITLGRRPVPPSITAPAPLTVPMSDAGAYSDPFTLAGDTPPNIDKVEYIRRGEIRPSQTYRISWDASAGKVRVLTGELDLGVYTVTLTDTATSVSCDWQMTILPFVVPIRADKPEVTPNRYIIEKGESITFTADTSTVIQGGYIAWEVRDLGNTRLLKYETKNPFTYTPAQNVIYIPFVMRDKLTIWRSNVLLDSIEVFLRVKVTQGANSRWLRENVDGLRFVTTGEEADFSGIYIDSVANEIPRTGNTRKYAFSSAPVNGGMILTLLPALLSTLPDGPHTLTFQYNDRKNTVSTVFYVGNTMPGDGAGGEADVPQTGDSAPLALLIGLALFAGAGLGASRLGAPTVVRRRKRAE